MKLFKRVVTFAEAEAAVFAAVATAEEKQVYRQSKAREARESQAAWSRRNRWSQ
jgi:hypothetical protein